MKQLKIIYKSTDELIPYVNNPRNNGAAIDPVASSIKNFGFKVPIVIDSGNEIIAGHTRLKAAKKLGLEKVPCIIADDLSEQKVKAFRLADNKVSELAEWDFEMLDVELEELNADVLDWDMSEFGFEINNEISSIWDAVKDNPLGDGLSNDFLIPPFSIIDARKKEWQDRKRGWVDIGIASEVGREDNLIFHEGLNNKNLRGTSVFDPALCEVMYKWFTPSCENKNIFDPFAGGSVRGIVANRIGNNYIGIELRRRQIDANYKNLKEVGQDKNYNLEWICDDSTNMDEHIKDNTQDLVFTCPPYFDLEVYSDDNKDISNMDYDEFRKAYKTILSKACNKLKDNRFFIVVIGDVRDKSGVYRGLVNETANILTNSGLYYYNHLILAEALGSAALRARKLMRNRKVVKTHQEILVFYKGNIKEIQKHFEPIEIKEITEEDTE